MSNIFPAQNIFSTKCILSKKYSAQRENIWCEKNMHNRIEFDVESIPCVKYFM